MKQGDELVCPKCGQNSFLVKKTKMNGWEKAGEYLACSACLCQIEEIKEAPLVDTAGNTSHAKDIDKLKSFLDTDDDNVGYKSILDSDKNAQKSFCRDCKHFVSHPFMDRCGLHKKDVNPMDDCKDFIKN